MRPSDLRDNPPPVGSDLALLDEVRQGSQPAADRLYRRYVERIRALARHNISRGLAGRIEVDDIVQSVFRRFFQAARTGRYHLPSGEELWDLLLVITLNRVRSAELFHRAGKRDLRQTVALDTADGSPRPDAPHDDGLEAFLTLAVEEALLRLPDHYREVVRLRMQGYEVAEIAEKTARSKRTSERMLQEARSRLRSLLNLEN